MNIIVWFKSDLRLADHAALWHANQDAVNIIPVYVFDESIQRPLGAASKWWLHQSLQALSNSLKQKGVRLILRKGDSEKEINKLITACKAEAIYWNRAYEPTQLQAEKQLVKKWRAKGLTVKVFSGNLLTEPWSIKNKAGQPYKVFTPFKKAVLATLRAEVCLPVPRAFKPMPRVSSERLSSWNLLPTSPDWGKKLAKYWQPGEKAALKVLENFVKNELSDYSAARDQMSLDATSHLSPYLHFGEISVWQIYAMLSQRKTSASELVKAKEVFLSELIWRDFNHHLLFHFPRLADRNFQEKFNHFQWKQSQVKLQAWKRGQTGYPIVDAGMRELWETGYMHNRVRMIVASFLIKDLLIDWREGEKWFWDTLCDADLANNAGNWQWVAGSGADAAPFFRIFNPVLQGEKFDAEGEYVRKWLPVLKHLDKKYIHKPWAADEALLEQAKLALGSDYPLPIVDHKTMRDEALLRYKRVQGGKR